jgi:2-iminobutanoate/2-iminopropanoate deaminase
MAPVVGQLHRIAVLPQELPLTEGIEHLHREVAGQVVVTGPGASQFRVAGAGAGAQMSGTRRERHETFQGQRDVRIGEAEIAVPALPRHDNQAGLDELGEVTARRREAQTRLLSELARRQRRPGHECHEHMGARRIADERRDGRNIRAFPHSLMFSEPCRQVKLRCWTERRGRTSFRHDHAETAMTNQSHDIGIARQIGSYSDGVEAPAGARWLFTAGTPGLDSAGKLPADIAGQAEIAWAHITAMLKEADMTVEDIVKVTQYLVRASDIPAYAKVRSRALGNARPASMLLVVPALVRPDFLIEIEACAAKAQH